MSRVASKYMPMGALRLTGATGKPGGEHAGLQVKISSNLYSVMLSVKNSQLLLKYGLQHRFYDLLTHHRLSVIKNNSFPSEGKGKKRENQKFLAANYFRATRAPDERGGMKVEGLGRMSTKPRFDTSGGVVEDYFLNAETGKRIRANGVMLMPIGKLVANFRQKVRDRKFVLIKRKNLPWLLVEKLGAGRLRKDGSRLGERDKLIAVLGYARTQRPILGFYGQIRRILPTHQGKMDKMMERMLTAAGRRAISTEMLEAGTGKADSFRRRIKKAEEAGDKQLKAEATAIEKAFDSKGGI